MRYLKQEYHAAQRAVGTGPRFATKTARGTNASSFAPRGQAPASPASRGQARGRARGQARGHTIPSPFGLRTGAGRGRGR
jgi:hypothetical protein